MSSSAHSAAPYGGWSGEHHAGWRAGDVRGRDHRLGYNIIVEFPAHSAGGFGYGLWGGFPWSFPHHFAGLTGQNGASTPALSAEVAGHYDGIPGRIYIVSSKYWTSDGHVAAPGSYGGAIQVFVTAGESRQNE